MIAGLATSPLVWLVDPRTDTITRALPLDVGAEKLSSSGGEGYVTGIVIAPDAARRWMRPFMTYLDARTHE